MNETMQCPACGGTDFVTWKLPKLMVLHWVINPALTINELLLGQRVPARMYECRTCPTPFMRRCWVRCPSCQTMHNTMIWSGRYGFGNWLGFVCPDCGGRIPCLWNCFSLVVLAVTSPLWWPVLWLSRKRLLAGARRRAQRARTRLADGGAREAHWLLPGAAWGGVMWIFFCGWDAVRGKLTAPKVLVNACIWAVAGLVFGRALTWYLSRRGRPT